LRKNGVNEFITPPTVVEGFGADLFYEEEPPDNFSRAEGIMENISRVVQQLKKELEKELGRAKTEVERYGAALVALGSKSLRSGQRRLSVAARKRISLAQKARWAKVKRLKKPA
jgi:hypothetical protein